MDNVPESQTTTDEFKAIVSENNETLLAMIRDEINERLRDVVTKTEYEAGLKRIREIETDAEKLRRDFNLMPEMMATLHTAVDNLSQKLDSRSNVQRESINAIRELVKNIRDSVRDGNKVRDDAMAEIRDDQKRISKAQDRIDAEVETNKQIIEDTRHRSADITTALWGGEQLVGLPLIPMVRNHEKSLTTVIDMISNMNAKLQIVIDREEARQQMIQNAKDAVINGFKSITVGTVAKATIGGTAIAGLIEFVKTLLGG